MIAFFTYLYILEFTPYQLIETFHSCLVLRCVDAPSFIYL